MSRTTSDAKVYSTTAIIVTFLVIIALCVVGWLWYASTQPTGPTVVAAPVPNTTVVQPTPAPAPPTTTIVSAPTPAPPSVIERNTTTNTTTPVTVPVPTPVPTPAPSSSTTTTNT